MSGGAGFILDANNRTKNNRALLGRREAFQIKEANKFIQPSGRKYTFKQLTAAGLKRLKAKMKVEQVFEKKREVLRVSLTLVVTFIILLGISSLLNYIL